MHVSVVFVCGVCWLGLVVPHVQAEDNDEWYVEPEYSDEDSKPKQMSAKELMRQGALEVKKQEIEERATVSYSIISGPGGKRVGRKKYVEVGQSTPRKHSRPFYFGDGPERLKFKPAPEGWPLPEIPEHYYLPPTKKSDHMPTRTANPGVMYEEKGKGKKVRRRNRRVRKERSVTLSEEDENNILDKKNGLGHFWAKKTFKPKNKTVEFKNVQTKTEEPLILKPAPPNWPEPTFRPRTHWQQQPQGRQQGYQRIARRPPMQKMYAYDYANKAETTYHTLLPRRSRITNPSFYTAKKTEEPTIQYQQVLRTFASRYEMRRFQKIQTQSERNTMFSRRQPNQYNNYANDQAPSQHTHTQQSRRYVRPTLSPKV